MVITMDLCCVLVCESTKEEKKKRTKKKEHVDTLFSWCNTALSKQTGEVRAHQPLFLFVMGLFVMGWVAVIDSVAALK